MRQHDLRIGQMIRAAREVRGMTQMNLSEKIGVSYQQVQKYESGSDISVERLKQIAKAFNLPITLFFSSSMIKIKEKPGPFGKISEDEALLLGSYRRIKSRNAKKAVLELLKTFYG